MRWAVEDFKGLRRGSVSLLPGTLTVLAGANSSGKSSLLQSLLLAAQSNYHSGPVVLNGPLVRLGTAFDLVRAGSAENAIQLALTYHTEDDATPVEANLVAKLNVVPSSDGVTLRVQRVEVSLEGIHNGKALRLDKHRSRASDLKQVADIIDDPSITDVLHTKSLISDDRRVLRTYVGFRGLVPAEVIELHSPSDIEVEYRKAARLLAEKVRENLDPQHGLAALSDYETLIAFREFARLIESELGERPAERVEALDRLAERGRGNPYRLAEEWERLSDEDREYAFDLAARARAREPFVRVSLDEIGPRQRGIAGPGLLEARLIQRLAFSGVALNSLASSLLRVAHRVQYLGPLRDEPRVVWNQWNELTRGLPVGTRGEFSAVVLSKSARHAVQHVRPDGRTVEETLDLAVNQWLGYLDIGEAVVARDLGKLGVGVEVNVSGAGRDLTAVGVGVSQALPLVVALLSAPRRSIFIVEQPELHLHPAVQARLADFMVKARPDLTCLVETHSEAFLTRIRRRVAEAQVDPAKVNVVFVEPSPDGSRVRELEMNAFGDLSDWPAGFLVGPEEDTQAILKANVARLGGSR